MHKKFLKEVFKYRVLLDFEYFLVKKYHTIFQYFLVKSDLCSEKDVQKRMKRMPNIQITTKK